jgi:hypothetical protein
VQVPGMPSVVVAVIAGGLRGGRPAGACSRVFTPAGPAAVAGPWDRAGPLYRSAVSKRANINVRPVVLVIRDPPQNGSPGPGACQAALPLLPHTRRRGPKTKRALPLARSHRDRLATPHQRSPHSAGKIAAVTGIVVGRNTLVRRGVSRDHPRLALEAISK